MSPEQLEKELEDFCGVPADSITVCSSGTAALHLAWTSIRASEPAISTRSPFLRGSIRTPAVFCNDFTMIACPRAIVMSKFEPVLIQPKTRTGKDRYQLDLERIGKALESVSDDGKDVITNWNLLLCHIYGDVSNKEELVLYLKKWEHNGWIAPKSLNLVEDCAEVHGYKPFMITGMFRNHIATWSFYKNKTIAGEEGGCLAFSDDVKGKELKILTQSLRCLGFDTKEKIPSYNHIPGGMNYRLAPSLARIISNELRGKLHYYQQRLEVQDKFIKKNLSRWEVVQSQYTWMIPVVAKFDLIDYHRDLLITMVKNRTGVDLRKGFTSLSGQEEFGRDSTPLSRELGEKTLLIPVKYQSGFTLTDRDIDLIADVLDNNW
jgi:dTDP-4-amino-4,6-dideoxygalactose transaminase